MWVILFDSMWVTNEWMFDKAILWFFRFSNLCFDGGADHVNSLDEWRVKIFKFEDHTMTNGSTHCGCFDWAEILRSNHLKLSVSKLIIHSIFLHLILARRPYEVWVISLHFVKYSPSSLIEYFFILFKSWVMVMVVEYDGFNIVLDSSLHIGSHENGIVFNQMLKLFIIVLEFEQILAHS